MSVTSIICPKCNSEISVDKALTHQVEEGLKLEFERQREEDRKKLLIWKEEKEKSLKVELTETLKKNLLQEQTLETEKLKKELELKELEIKKAQELESSLRSQKNDLDKKMQQLEIETQRRLDLEIERIRKEAEEHILEKNRLKDAEKDKQMEDMRRKIEELQLKANLTSQQLQGEVLELELENLLKTEFPLDDITPVPKGMNGADVLQKVFDSTGKLCGLIIWESKRTKNWDEKWVQKLKDDQRLAKADVAVLVSSILPEGIKNFGPWDKIYVTNFDHVLGVTKLIRSKIIELCFAKQSLEGKNEKKEIIWNYLSGVEFRQRVETIVEAFSSLKEDLEREKRMYQTLWAKREKQIQRVLDNTFGMYGDLQGLMGSALPQIKSLELENFELLETPEITLTTQTKTIIQSEVFNPTIEES